MKVDACAPHSGTPQPESRGTYFILMLKLRLHSTAELRWVMRPGYRHWDSFRCCEYLGSLCIQEREPGIFQASSLIHQPFPARQSAGAKVHRQIKRTQT